MRFAIWTAVSTLEQVDGASLDHQLEKCRAHGQAEGWEDTGLVFTADGYSRTGYVNLSDAERDIPPLHNCLDALRANHYDLLVCFNYDRFGDLIIMIANEFRNNKKQLFSLSQPTPVTEHYDPYMDDSSFVMQAFAPIWDKMRKADLRRKWRAGMPKRLDLGLTPLSTPFGYRWKGKKEVPDPIPIELNLVLQMRDWLMSGQSVQEITRHCDSSGVPSPRGNHRWDASTVKAILANPYYAGQVALHKTIAVPTPGRKRKYRQVAQPRSRWLVKPGKHKPIWTLAEHQAIVRELDRRHELNQHSAFRYPLSGMLYCGVCGRKLYRHSHLNASAGHRTRIWTCNKSGESHIIIEYDEGFPLVASRIQAECKRLPYNLPAPPSSTVDTDSAIKELSTQRKRVQDSAKHGVYTPEEAAAEIANLEKQMDSIQLRIEKQKEQAATRRLFLDQMSENLDYIADWIMSDDPARVHQLLSSIIDRIIISPDHQVEIKFR